MSEEEAVRQAQDKARLRAVVRGRVQGVGFRFFVLGEARRLHLAGGVWNRSDGAVELEAQGPRAALLDLLAALRQGPRFSRVDSVEEDWAAHFEAPEGFEVRR